MTWRAGAASFTTGRPSSPAASYENFFTGFCGCGLLRRGSSPVRNRAPERPFGSPTSRAVLSCLRLGPCYLGQLLLRERRYVSMGDIVDISPIKSMVRTIDFRVFVSLWCGVDTRETCFSGLCCAVSGGTVAALCQMPTIDADLYCLVLEAVKKVVYILYKMIVEQQYDCMNIQQNNDGALDPFQPDEELKRRKKISYVRRTEIYNASQAENAALLAFGTLFSGPYKGSESFFDISMNHQRTKEYRVYRRILKIMAAVKEFPKNRIKAPFLCVQLRLLDGQFKNHWKATFSALKRS
ncbi:hypothetical protein U9M48_038139 [Paspalum notatum var. saurae]|uniref:Uncharacterized protein n=1 Tax=Paspalum notatum var. saurae TaxID=547442 RepID=A0AAQ3ULA3_PASNO